MCSASSPSLAKVPRRSAPPICAGFGHAAEAIDRAVADLLEATRFLQDALADGQIDQALAGATPYLRQFALTAGAAYLAKAALGRAGGRADRALPLLSRQSARRDRGPQGNGDRRQREPHRGRRVAGRLKISEQGSIALTDHVIVERRGAVQVIRMNRPDKKNALTRAMYAKMSAALADGDADPAIRVHVFLGVPGAFSSGNDIADFMAYAVGGELGTGGGRFPAGAGPARKSRWCRASTASPSASARRSICIATSPSRRGAPCSARPSSTSGWCRRRHRACSPRGSSAASRHSPCWRSAQGFSADRAKTAGLIYDVVDEDDLEREVFAAAEEIAAKPPRGVEDRPRPDARSARRDRRPHPRGSAAFRRTAALRRGARRLHRLHEPQEGLSLDQG